jgi:hypothetical protein
LQNGEWNHQLKDAVPKFYSNKLLDCTMIRAKQFPFHQSNDLTTNGNHTAPAQTCNHALVVGSWTRNSQPETSFYLRVTKKLQMPLAGFNLPVADACCGLKPAILVDCGLRFWSVRHSFFPLAGFSCGIAPACLQVFQLRV